MSIDFNSYYRNTEPDRRYLFHYTSQQIGMEYILSTLELKFSTRKNSHDPLESDEVTHTTSFPSPERLIHDREITSQRLEYLKQVNVVRNSVKYACFSVDSESINSFPWDKGCFRSRMWSQYANAHKGVCLVFDWRSLIDSALMATSDVDAGWVMWNRINYTDSPSEFLRVSHIEPIEMGVLPSVRVRENSGIYLFTKLKDYTQESEYRICIFDGVDNPNRDIFVSIRSSIQGIILGENFPTIYLPVMRDIVAALGIPVTKVNWFRGNPEFVEL